MTTVGLGLPAGDDPASDLLRAVRPGPRDVELPFPPLRRAWTTLAILVTASLVAILDRNILGLLVDDVRADLKISDVQVSLLQGLSFALIYSMGGLVLGILADRWTRKWLLFIGIVCWSSGVGFGSLATGFGSLFASRVLVGLGEATLAPVAISMIGDLFAPAKRGRALSVYMMAQAISPGLSIFMLGFLSQMAHSGKLVLVAASPWRTAFAVCGLLGLAVAVLVMTVKEPVRRRAGVQPSSGRSVPAPAGYLWRNRGFFVPFYLAFSLSTTANYALGAWSPMMLARQFGMPIGHIGRDLGVAAIVAGVVGGIAAWFIVHFLYRSQRPGAKLTALAMTSLCLSASGLGALAPNAPFAIILISLMSVGFPLMGTLSMASAQEAVPNTMSGVTTGLFTLSSSVIGLGLGPLLVALLTEHLFGRSTAVGYSLLLVVMPALLLSAGAYRQARLAQTRLTAGGSEMKHVMAHQA